MGGESSESISLASIVLIALGGVGSVFNALCFFVLRGLRTDIDNAEKEIEDQGERLTAVEVICGVYRRR